SMVRIGENKHKAKQTSLDGSTEGIFSKSTYDNYKQVSAQFIAWLKEQYSNIKHIDDLPRGVVMEYLQQRQQEGLSSNTLSQYLGEVNKLFGVHISKQEAGLKQRNYKTISRSRDDNAYNQQYNPANYTKQIAVAKAFGLRLEIFITGDYRLKEGSIYKCQGKSLPQSLKKAAGFEMSKDGKICRNK